MGYSWSSKSRKQLAREREQRKQREANRKDVTLFEYKVSRSDVGWNGNARPKRVFLTYNHRRDGAALIRTESIGAWSGHDETTSHVIPRGAFPELIRGLLSSIDCADLGDEVAAMIGPLCLGTKNHPPRTVNANGDDVEDAIPAANVVDDDMPCNCAGTCCGYVPGKCKHVEVCTHPNCKVAFWADIVERRAWKDRARSLEDARMALSSAELMCRVYHQRCGIPSRTLGACDLQRGHNGTVHSSKGDGFYNEDYDVQHRAAQRERSRTDSRTDDDNNEHHASQSQGDVDDVELEESQ